MDEKLQKAQLIEESKEKLYCLTKSLEEAIRVQDIKKTELYKTLGDFNFNSIKNYIENNQSEIICAFFKENSETVLKLYNEINGIDRLIDNYENKKIEIKNRYDEEIEILSIGLDLQNQEKEIKAENLCPKCKKVLKPGSTFCGYCGKRIK